MGYPTVAPYRLDERQQALMLSCCPLMRLIVNRYVMVYDLDRDDAESVALERLCRSAYLFDERHGAKFCSYAGQAVRRELHRLLQLRASRPRMLTGILSSVEDENDRDPVLEPADERTMPASSHAEIADRIGRLKAVLPAYLWEAIWLYCGEGLPLKDVARRLGMSHQGVLRRLKVATQLARKRLPRFVEGESVLKQQQRKKLAVTS
jgi:RNA polymerase sigma factor (sigma-70 family)